LKTTNPAELADVSDRVLIREVIGRYFYAVDRGDWAALASCFAVDAHYEAADGFIDAHSRDAILEVLTGGSPYAERSHVMSSVEVVTDRDTASGDTFAIAYLLDGGIDKGRFMVRGLQYLDSFVRTADGWRIKTRRHITRWQFDALAVPPMRPKTLVR